MTNKRAPQQRMSGILAHPSSFPSRYGIGDFGKSAFSFIDFLEASGQHLWQLLPLGPTGFADSPYQLFSSFAGQPLFISLDKLKDLNMLTSDDLAKYPDLDNYSVDYEKVSLYKNRLLKKAYENFKKCDNYKLRLEYEEFLKKNIFWIDEYALYMALKTHNDNLSWLEWKKEFRFMNIQVEKLWVYTHSDDIELYKFIQFIFFKQWFELKAYANSKKIYIITDIPIFVSLDSADVWNHKNLFKLDENGYPTVLSGVPPDYFSTTGQLWGNPIYDWKEHKKNDYDWWIKRISHQLTLGDFLRIDHFRGFEACWAVPRYEATAVNGTWIQGPGKDFFISLQKKLGDDLPILAEDLGMITTAVEKLRDRFGFPGMKVLQFAFDDPRTDNSFMPHNYLRNSVCYTGTHDNDTTLSWYNTASHESQNKVRIYMNSDGRDISWDFIRTALGSVSKFAIFPIQDVLSLGNEARMNLPGTTQGNWKWRFTNEQLNDNIVNKLKMHTTLYGR